MKWLALALCLFVTASAQANFTQIAVNGGGVSSCQTLGTLTCDGNGWTQFSVGPGGFVEGNTACGSAAANVTCIFYVRTVANGGSDANVCSFSSPCATPEHAASLLRNNSPDWMLMEKNQTWNDHAPVPTRQGGGLDANHPWIFSSYDPAAAHNPPVPNPSTGGARPLMILGATWFGSNNYAIGSAGGGGGSVGNFIAFVGLDLYACTRDPNASLCSFSLTDAAANWSGAVFLFTTNDLLIEDCRLRAFTENVVTSTQYLPIPGRIYVRRSQFLDSYPGNPPTTSQGLLVGDASGGPAVQVVYQSLFDKNGWNTSGGISWAPQVGGNHNLYLGDSGSHGDSATYGTGWTTSGNIFSNPSCCTQQRMNGQHNNNLFVANSGAIGIGSRFTYNGSISGNVLVNGLPATDSVIGVTTASREFDGNAVSTTSTTNIANNLFVNSPADPGGQSSGINLVDGYNGATVTGNIIYNLSFGGSNALLSTNGGLLTQTITNGGSGYTDNSMAITAAVASSSAPASDGQNYVVVTVANTAAINTWGGVMYKVGANAVQGPFGSHVVDSTHVEIYGTNFSSAPPVANSGGTFTGTLYYPYYQVNMTGSATGTGAQMDIFSVGGVIVAANYYGSDSLGTGLALDAAGKNYHVNDVLSATVPGGSGLQITLNSVSANTVSASGCNLAINNVVDANGSNACTFTDPNRTAGSYYATLAGSTTNATFTGVVASGVVTVSGISGTLSLGDAIKWSGQTKADYIKFNSTSSGTPCNGLACTGNGGNGTYALTGINTTVGSQSMSSYAAQQLINLMRNQSKASWNTNLTACAVNTYIKAGFGITDTCNVNQ